MTAVALSRYLVLSAILFALGVFGMFVNRKNIIILLMCLELTLLAANINFVAFAAYHNHLHGQIWTLFVLTVAAAEVAVGLAACTAFFRLKESIGVEDMRSLRDEPPPS